MTVKNEKDLKGLIAVGRIVRAALNEMEQFICVGVSTADINRIGADAIRNRGGRSAPVLVYDFPGEVCISVNDEIVHGIPSGRIVKEGDLVKIDVTVEKDGYMADAAVTVPVGTISERKRNLIDCAKCALRQALHAARVGNRVCDIGRAIEREAVRMGFSPVRDLLGHGIGRTIHEEPYIPNYYNPHYNRTLTEGLVIAIEPMMTMGSGRTKQMPDAWTISSADGAMAVHFEQTVVVGRGEPLILTGAA